MSINWTKHGQKHLLNRKITEVRYMTDSEADALGWERRTIVLVLDNGTVIYPSQDDEGNGPGALFGNSTTNGELTFPVL